MPVYNQAGLCPLEWPDWRRPLIHIPNNATNLKRKTCMKRENVSLVLPLFLYPTSNKSVQTTIKYPIWLSRTYVKHWKKWFSKSSLREGAQPDLKKCGASPAWLTGSRQRARQRPEEWGSRMGREGERVSWSGMRQSDAYYFKRCPGICFWRQILGFCPSW